MISYDHLQAQLEAVDASVSAAEGQGAACGLVCRYGRAGLEWFPAVVGTAAAELLSDVAQDAGEALNGLDFALVLFLPDDDQDLDERFAALISWCQGFVVGFFYGHPNTLDDMGEESAEAIRDFMRIAAIEPEPDESPPQAEDERDFAEILEYVRAAAQLLYEEHAAPEADPHEH
ncbi:MAG TPA: UPF0149 family protein [Acidiferrobacteraceae bacterium]|nr:UPF0149 family protein [Acidiferrobacteraceae bacterium]